MCGSVWCGQEKWKEWSLMRRTAGDGSTGKTQRRESSQNLWRCSVGDLINVQTHSFILNAMRKKQCKQVTHEAYLHPLLVFLRDPGDHEDPLGPVERKQKSEIREYGTREWSEIWVKTLHLVRTRLKCIQCWFCGVCITKIHNWVQWAGCTSLTYIQDLEAYFN